MNTAMEERLREMGADPEKVEGFGILDESEVKRITLESFFKFAPEVANIIIKKRWMLFETGYASDHPFYISDNPVTMHNDQDHSPYGNIGFAVKGIQIYIPISSTLLLGSGVLL